MSATPVLILYSLAIVAASLAGGWLPTRLRLSHTRMQTMMSFVAGLMLGVALFHMLPHAAHGPLALETVCYLAMAGILAMFFMIRVFHVHQHGPQDDSQLAQLHRELVAGDQAAPQAEPHACPEQHGHSHSPHVPHGNCAGHDHGAAIHRFTWIGLALGLAIHTLIDGVAVGARVVHAQSQTLLPGFDVFLAVVLHKPLDAMSITLMMAAGGWSRGRIWLVNFGFALMCPLGAILFVTGVSNFDDHGSLVVAGVLAFAAGAFLCISLADILPEVSFHSHDRLKLSVALLLGVALALAIGLAEHGLGGHSHENEPHPAPPGHSHDHGPDHSH